MAFALLIIGVILVAAGVRNTQTQLFTLLQGDFTGDSNFIFWFVAILIIGAVGYVKALKPISTGFLVLLIMVLFLTKGNPGSSSGGFFAKFLQGIGSTQSATAATNTPTSGASPLPLTNLAPLQGVENIGIVNQQLSNGLSQMEQNLLQQFSEPIQ
jgi:hypothetical protein